MIVINFYFTGTGGWIEYSQNKQITIQTFSSAESLHNFIKDNDLPLTYKGCISCSS
jgi:hypothetical protein